MILFARNQRPQDEPIRAVLGIRGEPSTPEDAAQGLVWRSIVDLLERPGSENDYVSVVDQERGMYAQHPWSVGGGGATELKALIEMQLPIRVLASDRRECDRVSVAITGAMRRICSADEGSSLRSGLP